VRNHTPCRWARSFLFVAPYQALNRNFIEHRLSTYRYNWKHRGRGASFAATRIVSNWRRRFADHGLDGLKDRPRAGKKPIYGNATNKRILGVGCTRFQKYTK
jgi:hypothetical protein